MTMRVYRPDWSPKVIADRFIWRTLWRRVRKSEKPICYPLMAVVMGTVFSAARECLAARNRPDPLPRVRP